MTMRSEKDQVFGNLIESSQDNTEVKIIDNGKEQDKENAGNMSGHHSYEFKIVPKNEGIQKNRNIIDDDLVFYMDKNVMARKLPETIVVSNCKEKEVTYNVVKDVCVHEGVPMMPDKFLSNEKDSVNVNSKPFGSKSSEDIKLNQENVIVKVQEVKDNSKVPPCDVVATSRSVSKEALTLGDFISMEGSQRPPNKNNTNGPEDTDQEEKTEEPILGSLRYISTEMAESENQRLNDVIEDSYDHNLFSSSYPNGFGERSFSEAEPGLAHVTYSGLISVSGNISVRSDGSTVSGSSFAFPLLQSEWNNSPVRMVKAEKTKIRKEKGWRHYSILLCCRF